jgi:hypothetical protein
MMIHQQSYSKAANITSVPKLSLQSTAVRTFPGKFKYSKVKPLYKRRLKILQTQPETNFINNSITSIFVKLML